ncbi:hypothetical protein GW916_03385 [bacterium]|nr:hypothetical protein [bacterium]
MSKDKIFEGGSSDGLPASKIKSQKFVTDDKAHVRPSLLDFEDYRDFLEAFVEFQKKKNPRLSTQAVTRNWGLSRAFLSMLFAKKRHISLASCSALLEHLNLSDEEEMLLTLELLYMTASGTHKKYFRMIKAQLKGIAKLEIKATGNSFDEDVLRFGSELNLILTALMETTDFRPDVDWIMSRLVNKAFSRDEVEAALQAIIGSSKEKPKNGLTPVYYVGESYAELYGPGHKAFGTALEDPASHMPQAFTSMALSLSEEGQKKAVVEFGKFCRKLVELATPEEPEDQNLAFVFSGGLFCVAKPQDAQAELPRIQKESTKARKPR